MNYLNSYYTIGRTDFLSGFERHLSQRDLERIESAYIFAKYGHRGQYRDGGVIRYFEHPKSVASILYSELGFSDWKIIVMALLHDMLEDSFLLSVERIHLNFGGEVADGLELLTKRPGVCYVDKLVEEASWKVLVVKLADRLQNLRSLENCTLEKQLSQIEETKDKYLPLADVLISRMPGRYKERGVRLKIMLMEICEQYDRVQIGGRQCYSES